MKYLYLSQVANSSTDEAVKLENIGDVKENKNLKERKLKVTIAITLKKHDNNVHPKGQTPLDDHGVYRVKVMMAFL